MSLYVRYLTRHVIPINFAVITLWAAPVFIKNDWVMGAVASLSCLLIIMNATELARCLKHLHESRRCLKRHQGPRTGDEEV